MQAEYDSLSTPTKNKKSTNRPNHNKTASEAGVRMTSPPKQSTSPKNPKDNKMVIRNATSPKKIIYKKKNPESDKLETPVIMNLK